MPLRILLADERREEALPLTSALEALGHRLSTVISVEQALEQSRSFRPGAIIVSATLPEPGGAALIRQLKADPELTEIGVLLLLAEVSSDEVIFAGMALGVDCQWERPIDPVDIAVTIRFMSGSL